MGPCRRPRRRRAHTDAVIGEPVPCLSQQPHHPRASCAGVVERITYQNPDNGYTVVRLAPERVADAPTTQDARLVPIVGMLPDLSPGEAIVAHGWWRNDPKHE
jgi:exodeoxyribonuclease V alpha subunit